MIYPWHQRGIRIYDPDGHLIEVSESMETVAFRENTQLQRKMLTLTLRHSIQCVLLSGTDSCRDGFMEATGT